MGDAVCINTDISTRLLTAHATQGLFLLFSSIHVGSVWEVTHAYPPMQVQQSS